MTEALEHEPHDRANEVGDPEAVGAAADHRGGEVR